MNTADFRDTKCPQCGEDACNDKLCRSCDIDQLMGVCWNCRRQVERFDWDAKMFDGDPPPPNLPEGHAPICHVGKTEERERERIVAWLREQAAGDARFLTEEDLAYRAAAAAIERGEHRR